MKLLMMTHGDRHQYTENDGSSVQMYRDNANTQYYHDHNHHSAVSYQDQPVAYSEYNKYYDSTTTPMTPTYLTTSAMDNIRRPVQATAYNSENAALANEDLLLSVAEEQLRPLIKEELRYTIQSKRLAKGLPSHVEIEYKVPEPEPETEVTLLKKQRRRQRNKVAAAKCRFKKKILSEKLIEESEELENQNHRLKGEVQRLQEERQKLIYILNLHRPTCIVRSPRISSPNQEQGDMSLDECCQPSLCNKTSNMKMTASSRASSCDNDTASSLSQPYTSEGKTYSVENGHESMDTSVQRSVIVQSCAAQYSSA